MKITGDEVGERRGTGENSLTVDALVIGAGFSGLYQLHRLRDDLGLRTRVLEMAPALGGTWYWNRYPGARCDSLSHSYRFMFSAELASGWESSERYPGPEENCRYLTYVADRLDLHRDICLNTRVTAAYYVEATGRWRILTHSGDSYLARYLIAGVGCLSSANVPDVPGLETFAGRWFHTGQWPHEGVDFRGQCVGQIGTGSSGIQAAPVIAKSAAHLTVFQRTANYSIPAHNAPLSDEFKRYVRDNFAAIRQRMLTSPNGMPFALSQRLAVETEEEERNAIFEEAWRVGGLQFRSSFFDLMTDERANAHASAFLKKKIRSVVNDPETAAKLTRIDHPFGTKRPPIDSFYFEMFNQAHVDLVDLKETPIEAVTPDGIRTVDKDYPLDIIVFATGFDAMTGSLLKIDIRGRQGRRLADSWARGPVNYLGLQVTGFPNLFTITGPGSPSVLGNMPVAIEQHVDWITNCIDYLRRHDMVSIEATESAMTDWVKSVNDAANATLMPRANHSWYHGANIPGKPVMFMPYAGGLVRYREICEEVAADAYRGFVLTARSAAHASA